MSVVFLKTRLWYDLFKVRSHKIAISIRNNKNIARRCSTKSETSKYAECGPRIFSGIQPTGIPHIGNYAGAISNWVKLQKAYSGKMLLSVVDLHSFTVPQEKKQLQKNILDMTACLLACGIDPEKTVLFQQSMIPEHMELAWILSCLCTVSRLQRLPTWKDKKKLVREPNVGLLSYPILQAADILLYKSTLIPVGEDQICHVDLTQDLAKSFNRLHGKIFPYCKVLYGEFPKIYNLKDPSKKMSKSGIQARGRLDLTDPPEVILERIKGAKTDFTSEVTYDIINRPGVSNLIEIHMAVADLTEEEVVEESFLLAEDTGMYKLRLAKVVAEKLEPIREKVQIYQKDPAYLNDVLQTGAAKASVIAKDTMGEVRALIGIR